MADLTSTHADIPFRASFLKLVRAQQHLDEFKEVLAAYIASEIAVPIFDETADRPTMTGWQVRGVPDILSPIMGDIVHNLRSALDLMTCEICNDYEARFPFAKNEQELEGMITKRGFDKAGEAAVRLLREFAPYKGGNTELRAIHDLDIHDKHKALLPTLGVLGGFSARYIPQPDGPPKAEIKTGPFQLFMPKDTSLGGREAVETLEVLVQTATGVVEAFERLFVPAG